MEHQDWKTVVVRKKKPSKMSNENTTKVINNNKGKNSNKVTNSSIKKLENSEELKHNLVPKKISQEIIQLRQSKNLTIKDLATKLNMNKQDLTNIEQGKAIYNKAQINKIKNSLKN